MCVRGRSRGEGWAWKMFSLMSFKAAKNLGKSTSPFRMRQNRQIRRSIVSPFHRINFANLVTLWLAFQRS